MTAVSEDMDRNYRISLMLLVVLVVLFSVAWAWFVFNPVPLAEPQMTIDVVNYRPGEFCPGETMVYTYTVTIRDPGVFIFDVSIWRDEPRQVVEWGNSLRLVAATPDTLQITRRWRINPDGIYNTLTDRVEPWSPGTYQRQIAITASGRDTRPSSAVLPFTIREDCSP